MNLKTRIFLSVLSASGVVAIIVFLIQEWNFLHNHSLYTKAINNERLNNLAADLREVYSKDGTWNEFKNNPFLRIRLLENSLITKSHLNKTAVINDGQKSLQPLRSLPYGPNGKAFDNNVVLLDTDKSIVFGPSVTGKDVEYIALKHQEKIMGYLGLIQTRFVIDPRRQDFLTQQLTMVLIAISAFAVSLGISFPIANRLVSPLRAMMSALHELSSGKYDTRLEIQAGGELKQLANDFNNLAASLEKNRQTRCQYNADISHELLTPLTVLRAEIEAMLEGVRQTNPDNVASLHGEVLQLTRIVDDIHQLSLTDAGALSYRKEPCRLTDILKNAISGMKTDYAMKQITFKQQISAPEEIMVHADSQRLRQLFDNLLKNSLKYTDAGGTLFVNIEQSTDTVCIDFMDSSPGVAAPDLDRLFERFFRVERSRSRNTGGAGLGLAICKNIVEAHSGRISAQQSPLGGLWVRVELPLTGKG